MKTIITAMFGIATLIGSASSTATDEECYEHIVNSVSIHGSRYSWFIIRDAYNKGPFDAAIRVYDEAGNRVTSLLEGVNFEVRQNGSKFLVKGHIQGEVSHNRDRYRHIHIVTEEDALVSAWARWGTPGHYSMYHLPVHKRELTNTKEWWGPCSDPDEKS